MKPAVIWFSILVMASGCSDSKPSIALTMCSPDRSNEAGSGDPQTKPSARGLARTVSSRDIGHTVREMSWQLCNARTNHWIDDDYFRRELTALREGAFVAYGMKPGATAPAPSGDDLSICLTAAGNDRTKRDACVN